MVGEPAPNDRTFVRLENKFSSTPTVTLSASQRLQISRNIERFDYTVADCSSIPIQHEVAILGCVRDYPGLVGIGFCLAPVSYNR